MLRFLKGSERNILCSRAGFAVHHGNAGVRIVKNATRQRVEEESYVNKE
jgi:hypothetical protein